MNERRECTKDGKPLFHRKGAVPVPGWAPVQHDPPEVTLVIAPDFQRYRRWLSKRGVRTQALHPIHVIYVSEMKSVRGLRGYYVTDLGRPNWMTDEDYWLIQANAAETDFMDAMNRIED